jgi:HAMP domain-containing protein
MNALKNRAQTVVTGVALNSALPLENFDDLSLQNLVFKAEADESVAYINVLNPDNEQVVEGDYVKNGKTIDKKKKVEGSNILVVKSKILKGGEDSEEEGEEGEPEALGTVEGGFYLDAVIKNITKKKLIFSVGLSIISLIIVVVMYLFLSKEYVGPVLKLSKAASHLEEEKYEIVTDKSDELGNLGQIFKEMRSTVNNQKIILEKQVAERTSELNKEKDNVTKLLNNMSQAVFKVNKEKKIMGPISAYAKTLFGGELIGEDIFEVLYKDIDKGGVRFCQMESAYTVLYGGDMIQWFASDGILPDKLNVTIQGHKKILKIDHEPIYDDIEEVEFILYVIEDITEKVAAEENLAQKNEQLKIVQEELSFSNKKELSGLLKDLLELASSGIQSLEKLKRDYKDIELLRDLFRSLHTIKGSSGGLSSISAEVHSTEDLVSQVVKGEKELDDETWNKINQDVHELHGSLIKYVKVAVNELNLNVSITDKVFTAFHKAKPLLDDALINFKQELKDTGHFMNVLKEVSIIFSFLDEPMRSKNLKKIIGNVESNDEGGSLYSETAQKEIYDQLVLVQKGIPDLGASLSLLKEGSSEGEDNSIPLENINCLKNHILKLTESSELSLDSVEKAFEMINDGESVYKIIKSFEKVVSETCDKLGKKVSLDVNGNDLLVNPNIAKCLKESLIHIVRNSVDHGIEFPEDRISQGKNEIGSLQISFINDHSGLVLNIEDDGGGIDGDRLFSKALSSGAIKDSDLNEESKLDLLFLPSVSTKEEVSDLSGRGIGMDAVRVGLGVIGGKITVKSKLKEGTIFTITLPNS